MPGLTDELSIEDLYTIHHEKLELEWVAGQQGAKHAIIRDEQTLLQQSTKSTNKEARQEKATFGHSRDTSRSLSLVGHLNLIHPHQIQIIGNIEIKYLEGLRDISMQDAVSPDLSKASRHASSSQTDAKCRP